MVKTITTLVLIVYLIVMLVLSVIPMPEQVKDMSFVPGDFDKHMLGIAIFTLLFYLWLRQYQGQVIWLRQLLLVLLIPLAFGLLIELIQWPIPYRGAEWIDVLADVLGIGIGLIIICLLRLFSP